ncbi:MAG: hypothetical protein II579_07845 [Treponema sp.]|nr:hypothetical protein [Treponema sp.]
MPDTVRPGMSSRIQELKAYRTVGYYKGKETVIQVQRDFTKENKTKDFAKAIEKRE